MTEFHWDAVVIGAGPAGAVAARELARGGASVLLLDKREFPRDKVCGGCLNGHALGVLDSAGLGGVPTVAGGIPLRRFRLGVRGHEFELPLPTGMAVSRGPFDAALVDAAVEAGVSFLPRVEARVEPSEGMRRTIRLGRGHDARTVGARVVLVATGLDHSCLSSRCAPRVRVAGHAKIGTGCLLEGAGDNYEAGAIHMAVGAGGYIGLVRLADGRLHVAGAIRPGVVREAGGPGAAAETILSQAAFPPVPGLRSAEWRGTTGLTRRTYPIAEARLFLLGDAAGYVEPFTGEGIAWALAAGRAIGPLALQAIERWEPCPCGEWERLHGRVVRRRQIACRVAAAVLGRPLFVNVAFEAISRIPGPAARLLNHLNAPPRFLEVS